MYLQSSRRHSSSAFPKTELTFELGAFESEVDITIVDRIQSLLTPQPLSQTGGNGASSYRPYQSMAQVCIGTALDTENCTMLGQIPPIIYYQSTTVPHGT